MKNKRKPKEKQSFSMENKRKPKNNNISQTKKHWKTTKTKVRVLDGLQGLKNPKYVFVVFRLICFFVREKCFPEENQDLQGKPRKTLGKANFFLWKTTEDLRKTIFPKPTRNNKKLNNKFSESWTASRDWRVRFLFWVVVFCFFDTCRRGAKHMILIETRSTAWLRDSKSAWKHKKPDTSQHWSAHRPADADVMEIIVSPSGRNTMAHDV